MDSRINLNVLVFIYFLIKILKLFPKDNKNPLLKALKTCHQVEISRFPVKNECTSSSCDTKIFQNYFWCENSQLLCTICASFEECTRKKCLQIKNSTIVLCRCTKALIIARVHMKGRFF